MIEAGHFQIRNIVLLGEFLNFFPADSSSILLNEYSSLSILFPTKKMEMFWSHFRRISCTHRCRLSKVCLLVRSKSSNMEVAFLQSESANPVKLSCLSFSVDCAISQSWHLTCNSLAVTILDAKWMRWVGIYVFRWFSSVNCWMRVDLPTPKSQWSYLHRQQWQTWKDNDNVCS